MRNPSGDLGVSAAVAAVAAATAAVWAAAGADAAGAASVVTIMVDAENVATDAGGDGSSAVAAAAAIAAGRVIACAHNDDVAMWAHTDAATSAAGHALLYDATAAGGRLLGVIIAARSTQGGTKKKWLGEMGNVSAQRP